MLLLKKSKKKLLYEETTGYNKKSPGRFRGFSVK